MDIAVLTNEGMCNLLTEKWYTKTHSISK